MHFHSLVMTTIRYWDSNKLLLQDHTDIFLIHRSYTGITSIFDASSHLRTMPSRLAGRINLDHWHPVVNGSGGGTIISTLSFR